MLDDRTEIALPLAEEIKLKSRRLQRFNRVDTLQRSALSFALFNRELAVGVVTLSRQPPVEQQIEGCLLYTSDAADEV